MKIEINDKTIWINHNHLYYFYVVAKEGKLEAASYILSIGKPALSTKIRLLEESLGVTLFDRNSRGMELTPQGKIAYQFAKEIYKTTLQFIYGRADELLKSLKEKKLEVVLTNHPNKEHLKFFQAKIVQTQPAVICGTEKYRSLIKNFPNSLNNSSLIVPDRSIPIRNEFEKVLLKKKIRINIMSETNDENIAKLMALDGLAPMLASKSLVQDLLDSNELIEIGQIKELTNHIYALTNP